MERSEISVKPERNICGSVDQSMESTPDSTFNGLNGGKYSCSARQTSLDIKTILKGNRSDSRTAVSYSSKALNLR